MVGTASEVLSVDDKLSGVASLWSDVVSSLEQSVDADLKSNDVERALHGIKSIRQFVVASTTNKTVVGTSKILRPRLTDLLNRLEWWSSKRADLCSELCGLLNSLVRDCSEFAVHVLQNPDLTSQLISVTISPESDADLRQSCLLLLRSLFDAENLSSVLSKTSDVNCQRHSTALRVFTEHTLKCLLQLSYATELNQQRPTLTSNALCYVLQIFALLATDSNLAKCLFQLGAMRLCHEIIQGSYGDGAVSCIRTSVAATRFALKLLVHLFFHVDSAFDAFKKVYMETDARLLLACYSHLNGSVSTLPSTLFCRLSPDRQLSDAQHGCGNRDHKSSSDIPSSVPSTLSPTSPVSSGFPMRHETQLLLGLLRGLIYWRMLKRSPIGASDQFGIKVASSTGLRLTDNDVALLVIQPLTDGCLHVEDIRILSWVCHILVLVINRRSELHFWTVYTNSFIREVDARVTSVINAVQEASDYHNHIQFLEHLIPLVKLFACLASTSEAIRVLFTETTMCTKLIEFTINLKPLGPDHSNLVLEFQHSISVFLHVLSRSFKSHHWYFRQEQTLRFLINAVENNLSLACQGNSLCAALVEAASSTLINILLPMSPARQTSEEIVDQCVNLFIQLIKSSEYSLRTTRGSSADTGCDGSSSTEQTADLRPCLALSSHQLHQTLAYFRLNGIWGLANLLHGASADFCSDLFQRLVNQGAWLEILRPVLFVISQSGGLEHTSVLRRVSLESGFPPHKSSLSCNPSSTSDGIQKHRSDSLPTSIESLMHSAKGSVPVQTLLVYYTLMLLRNLLRHQKLIDSVVGEHWWNIAQLIISVLEGDYPRTVKEQGILVLAHIANGQSALEQLHQNEDLTEKIKLFMRSSDSYIKAAALTATYNLLGLGREFTDGFHLMDSSKQSLAPFFQPYRRRFRHSHHRHKDRTRPPRDTHSETPQSSLPDLFRRELMRCVAQSALQETEEIEDEEEQDIVVDHASTADAPECSSSTSLATEPSFSSMFTSPSTDLILSSDELLSSSRAAELPRFSRSHRSYRSWQLSPDSQNAFETCEAIDSQIGDTTRDELAAERLGQSSSDSSTFSGTSSTSCAEELGDVSANIADLDRSTAQDLCALSPECDERDLHSQSPSTSEYVGDGGLLPSSATTRAPLASEEAMDDLDPQAIQNLSNVAHVTTDELKPDSRETVPKEPLLATLDQTSKTTHPQSNWEVGFHHVLLPFLQQLDSNHILRNTWDWLMLRASSNCKPVQLHHLLTAWQSLYDTLPSSTFQNADCTTLDSSLFADCPTVNRFLERLRESTQSSSFRAVRHSDGYHHARRRHHCHRHQARVHGRRLADHSVVTATTSTISETTEPESISCDDPTLPDEEQSSNP